MAIYSVNYLIVIFKQFKLSCVHSPPLSDAGDSG